jgi:hypothetical protein
LIRQQHHLVEAQTLVRLCGISVFWLFVEKENLHGAPETKNSQDYGHSVPSHTVRTCSQQPMTASQHQQWSEEVGQRKAVPLCVQRRTIVLKAILDSCRVSFLFGIQHDCEFWKHFAVYAFPWFFVARVGAPVFHFRNWYKTQLYQPLAN